MQLETKILERLERVDYEHVWHPFTQEATAPKRLFITHGKGAYIFDKEGNAYLDLVSSWWVNVHGHANPFIARAIFEQALKLEHVIFAGCAHAPALQLCERLLPYMPTGLSRFFFSDNGSTAVEVAIKMAHQFWHNKGKARTTVLSFEGGYHGDTFGAMAAGKSSGFFQPFKDLLFETRQIPYPATFIDDAGRARKEEEALDMLGRILKDCGSSISAIVLEPLVQGASGMRMASSHFIARVIEAVRAYDIFVIFDEVMTGFYRTGTFLAAEQIAHKPDFLCLSKGLTGGFLPLALTVTSEDVFRAFWGKTFDKAFAHGHSYTANPLACAAALASLTLLERQDMKVVLKEIGCAHQKGLYMLEKQFPHIIKQPRLYGDIAAFDMPAISAKKAALQKGFLDAGLFLRPLKDTFYLIPSYVTEVKALDAAYQTIAKVLGGVLGAETAA